GERRVADVAAHDLGDRPRGVDDLVGGDSRDRAAEDDARDVAARLGRLEADGLEASPDLGDVLDADPVQLDVVPVGDVRGVATEGDGELADDAELLGRQGAAVDADAQHEVLVLELVRLELGGASAVDPGLALRVEAPPAEAAVEVLAGDRRE